jgi:hypothetical protein
VNAAKIKPCKRGHTARKDKHGKCTECERERARRRRAARPIPASERKRAPRSQRSFPFISQGITRAAERAGWEARAAMLAQPRTTSPFMEWLTKIVAIIVRGGSEAPRIRKIRDHGNPFMPITADVVDRLIVPNTAGDGRKTDYSLELPEALAAALVDGNTKPLVDLVIQAAGASRKAFRAVTAAANPTPVDKTDIAKMDVYTESDPRRYLNDPKAVLLAQEAGEQRTVDLPDVPVGDESDPAQRISHDLPATGALTAPNDPIAVPGGYQTGVTYGGESVRAQVDGLDSSDSSNYRGAKKDTGRAPAGPRQYSEGALAAGSLYPTRAEMAAGPGYTVPALYVPHGSHVRHAMFGEGVVLGAVGSDAALSVLVSFEDGTRWIAVQFLELLPGTAPDPKDGRAERERVERLQQEARQKVLEARIAKKEMEARRRVYRMKQAAVLQGRTEAELAELRALFDAAGMSLDKVLGLGGLLVDVVKEDG